MKPQPNIKIIKLKKIKKNKKNPELTRSPP
jgi:hypothetical protein